MSTSQLSKFGASTFLFCTGHRNRGKYTSEKTTTTTTTTRDDLGESGNLICGPFKDFPWLALEAPKFSTPQRPLLAVSLCSVPSWSWQEGDNVSSSPGTDRLA